MKKIKLQGFNNLKKQLSFSFYDFVIAPTSEEKQSYIRYINKRYSAKNIIKLLKKIVERIEANILSTSKQNYEPYGASSMILLSDLKCDSVQMHIDKSHITAHTYPDFSEKNDVVSFRVDIDISTCGEIAPLTALNDIFNFFDTDIVVIDYIVRGYTRDKKDRKVYMDHEVNSIKDFIKYETLREFTCKDLILQNDNIWQLKMKRVSFDMEEFFSDETKLDKKQKKQSFKKLLKEIDEIYEAS